MLDSPNSPGLTTFRPHAILPCGRPTVTGYCGSTPGETLSDQDARSLKEFVATQADPNQAYLLVVRLPASDPSTSPEQIARVRLMPNQSRIQFAGRVSESADGVIVGSADYVDGSSLRHPSRRART